MSTFLALVALFSVTAIAYPLVLYPLLVLLLARLRPRPWREGDVEQPVAHIIAVYNEEKRIRAKLENALSVVAPPGGLETVVVSDGSDDSTERVVREFASRGVRWIGCPRRGKEYAQLEAVGRTRAPILVFSDAASLLEPDAIRALVRPFADPAVAAVSGTDRLQARSGANGEDLYVAYEMRLRRAECLAGSLVGLSGCLFAARREICERWLPDVPSDMGSALIAIAAGRRAVAADAARCRYGAVSSAGREFRRKHRTALRGMRGLIAYAAAMRHGRSVERWQVVSHKALRFLAPGFAALALAAVGLGAALGFPWARWTGALVAAASAAAALGLALPSLSALRVFRALGFVALSLAAVGWAWTSVARRDRAVHWAPTERP